MCLVRSTLANMCPIKIHFNALDFNECRSEVMFLLMLSVSNFKWKHKWPPENNFRVELWLWAGTSTWHLFNVEHCHLGLTLSLLNFKYHTDFVHASRTYSNVRMKKWEVRASGQVYYITVGQGWHLVGRGGIWLADYGCHKRDDLLPVSEVVGRAVGFRLLDGGALYQGEGRQPLLRQHPLHEGEAASDRPLAGWSTTESPCRTRSADYEQCTGWNIQFKRELWLATWHHREVLIHSLWILVQLLPTHAHYKSYLSYVTLCLCANLATQASWYNKNITIPHMTAILVLLLCAEV